jgi:chromosome segregation ATPase
MREMDELSAGIEKLKRNSDSQKRLIEQLQKDRAVLIERTRFLGQKLSEAYVIYEEAGKRILDFVDKETAPVKNQIAELKAETKKLSGIEQELKIHSSYLSKVRTDDSDLKARLAEAEKAIKKLDDLVTVSRAQTERLKQKETKEDQTLESRLSAIKSLFEGQLKASQDRMGLKISEASEETLQDATDSINALAASHAELRKNLSQTSLFVRQLKVSTATLRKQLENAGSARTEIEKKLSANHASIKGLDSSVSRLARRLDSISLEDDKLEKRLAELRKSAEESIITKAGHIKAHLDSHQKRQEGLLESRLRNFSGDISAKLAKLNERLASERKQAGEEATLLNGRIIDSQKGAQSIKAELEKRLTMHQASIRDIDAAMARVAKRLEGINLEDEKLEKRLSEIRKASEESIVRRVGQLKEHVDSRVKTHDEMLAARLAGVNERLDSRISRISSELGSKVARINESIDAEKQDVSSRIQKQNAAFAKLAKDQHVHFESARSEIERRISSARTTLGETLDSRGAQLKTHLDYQQKKQSEMVESRLRSFSDDFAGKISRINEMLASERKQIAETRALMGEKFVGSEKNARLIRDKLEKRLTMHQASIRDMDSAMARMAKRLEGINLEDEKLEKRLSEIRKASEESIVRRVGQLKEHVDGQKERIGEELSSKISGVNQLLDSRISGASKELESKIARMNERLAAERKEIGDVESLISERIAEAHKVTSAREGRLQKEIEAARKQAVEHDSALSSRMEKQAADLRVVLKEHHDHLQSVKAELEKRVTGIRSIAEEAIVTKAGQMKSHLDAHQKRQEGLLESRLRNLSDDISAKLAKMNERLAAERKQAAEMEALLNGRIMDSQKGAQSIKAELEKRLTMHQASIRDMDSAMARVAKRLEGINLEDEKLEKRLSEIRKASEESAERRVGKLKSHMELADQKQLERIDAKLKALTGAEKAVSDSRKSLEDAIASKAVQLKENVDSYQKKQSELLEAKIKAVNEGFAARIARVNERLASESKQIDDMEALVNEKVRDSQEAFDSKLSESYAQIAKRISQVSSHVASEKKAIEGMRNALEREMRGEQKALSARVTAVHEKSLQRVSKLSEEVSAERKSLAEQRAKFSERMNAANQAISRLHELTGSLEGRLSRHEESVSARIEKNHAAVSQTLKRTESLASALGKSGASSKELDAKVAVMEARLKQLPEFMTGIEKKLSGQQEYLKGLESALTRVVKMVESVNLEDRRLDKKLSQDKEEVMRRLLEEQQTDKKETVRLREEVAGLKKDIAQWQQEQARLYELLKEEEA